MPDPRQGAARSVAEIIAAISQLSPAEREQLYITLLYGRARPPARQGPSVPAAAASALAGDVGAEPDPATIEALAHEVARTSASLPRAKKRPAKRIEIRLYDVDNIAPAFSERMMRRLEAHLAQIDDWTDQLSGHLRAMGLSFSVTSEPRLPTAKERRAMAPLVFPFYFMDETIGVGATDRVRRLTTIMDEHGIPEYVPGLTTKIRHKVASDWNNSVRAVTVPPGTLGNSKRAPKCTFLRGSLLASEARLDETYYANLVVHEFGHACNLSGIGAHVHDGSAMEPAKSTAEMKRELYTYNKRHATAISSTLSLLSAIALVAVMAACGHGQASRVCREEAPGQCRGCDTPSRLSAAEQQAQGTAAVASLIAAERKTGLLTDAVGGDLALRYFRVEPATLWDRGGDHEPVVNDLATLDAAARAAPRRGLYWVTLRVRGYAGSDRVFVQVDVIDHTWLGTGFLDESTTAEYCLRHDAGKLVVDVVTPVVIIKD